MKHQPVQLLISVLSIWFLAIPLDSRQQERFVAYHSEAEKRQFEQLDNHRDLFRLILLAEADEPTANRYVAQVDAFVSQLQWSTEDNARPNRKLKQLFKKTHASFLKRYDEQASVARMFIDGSYQCVSASILYAYILECLAIPFEIKETPTHVYVIAFPESFNIMIETTDPNGVFIPNPRAQAEYVNGLVKSKYLEQSYVNRVGVEKAFNEFFYGKTNIRFKELVGLAYYNVAISQVENDEFKAAYSPVYKANRLYPAKKHEYLQLSILGEIVNELRFEEAADWEAAVKLVNRSKREDAKSLLKYKFYEALDRNLWKSRQQDKADSAFAYISGSLEDEVFLNELTDHYLQEAARSLYVGGKVDEAVPFLERAIARNSEATLVWVMMKDYLFKHKMKTDGCEENLSVLDEWVARYPYLADDQDIRSTYLYNYISMLFNALKQEEFDKPLPRYFDLMLKELNAYDKHKNKSDEHIRLVIEGMAFYYLAKNERSKAKGVLEEGMNLYPENKRLKDIADGIKTM